MRSKAKWVEEGEKKTKYFLNIENKNYNSACIKKLITEDGTEITKLEDVINEQKLFFQNLYSSKYHPIPETSKIEDAFLNNRTKDIPKIDNISKTLCENDLTLNKCTQALKSLMNNKTLGIEGFSTNFYKSFWINFNDILYAVISIALITIY